jgi:heme-degrading monooxygenase HmoA
MSLRDTKIVRLWSAHTTSAQAPAYAEYLRTQVLPALRDITGYEGALLLERKASGGVDIVVLTLWESLEAIARFAGTDRDRAVVSDEAAALLTQFDQRVRHYDIVIHDSVVPE